MPYTIDTLDEYKPLIGTLYFVSFESHFAAEVNN